MYLVDYKLNSLTRSNKSTTINVDTVANIEDYVHKQPMGCEAQLT